MERVPCETCLKLALCRSRNPIECDDLHTWGTTNRDKWDQLAEYLPNYANVRIQTVPKFTSEGITTRMLDISMSRKAKALLKELEKTLKTRFDL